MAFNKNRAVAHDIQVKHIVDLFKKALIQSSITSFGLNESSFDTILEDSKMGDYSFSANNKQFRVEHICGRKSDSTFFVSDIKAKNSKTDYFSVCLGSASKEPYFIKTSEVMEAYKEAVINGTTLENTENDKLVMGSGDKGARLNFNDFNKLSFSEFIISLQLKL